MKETSGGVLLNYVTVPCRYRKLQRSKNVGIVSLVDQVQGSETRLAPRLTSSVCGCGSMLLLPRLRAASL